MVIKALSSSAAQRLAFITKNALKTIKQIRNRETKRATAAVPVITKDGNFGILITDINFLKDRFSHEAVTTIFYLGKLSKFC